MSKIIISNVVQLKALTQKFRAVSSILPTLQVNALERAADVTLSGIHRDMENNEFSKKIIEKTNVGDVILLDKGKKAIVHFISDYTSDDGFDVSSAREEGTDSHMIRPVKKKVLSWISNGVRRFSYGHKVSGIQRLLLIETNISKSKEKFKSNYEKEIVSTIKQMVSI